MLRSGSGHGRLPGRGSGHCCEARKHQNRQPSEPCTVKLRKTGWILLMSSPGRLDVERGVREIYLDWWQRSLSSLRLQEPQLLQAGGVGNAGKTHGGIRQALTPDINGTTAMNELRGTSSLPWAGYPKKRKRCGTYGKTFLWPSKHRQRGYGCLRIGSETSMSWIQGLTPELWSERDLYVRSSHGLNQRKSLKAWECMNKNHCVLSIPLLSDRIKDVIWKTHCRRWKSSQEVHTDEMVPAEETDGYIEKRVEHQQKEKVTMVLKTVVNNDSVNYQTRYW